MAMWPFRSRASQRLSAERKSWLDEIWRLLGSTIRTRSGVDLTLDRALKVSTVLACARVNAEDIASLPWLLVRGGGLDGFEEVVTDHALAELLAAGPNEFQTGFEFTETQVMHACLAGNSYHFVSRRAADGAILEMLPFQPGQVAIRKSDWKISYEVTAPTGQRQVFPASSIWHFKGPSYDGFTGLDTLKYAAEAIGLSIAAEESQAAMHRNGLRTSGLFSVEGDLDDKKFERLRAWIEQNWGGLDNLFKPLILDQKGEYTPFVMSGVDAQHLETRRFQIEEICRDMRTIPIMVGYADKTATYASAEQMFIAHNNNIGKTARRRDASGTKHLLTAADRARGLRLRTEINALNYADAATKVAYYTALYMIGAINPNEIRSLERMKPYNGGEKFRVPVNMVDPAVEGVPGDGETAKAIDLVKSLLLAQRRLPRPQESA